MNKKIKVILVLGLIILLSGCTVKIGSFDIGEKLNWLEGKIRINELSPGEWLKGWGSKTREEAKEILNKGEEMSEEAVKKLYGPAEMSKKLTPEEKAKIDGWILGKGLNEYGDPNDTVYAGGTPLFNEATGEKIDKYEYILSKHPELIQLFNLDK